MSLREAKQSLISHFGDAEAQLLENLPATAGSCVNWKLGFFWRGAAFLLTCLARHRDLKACKTLGGWGCFDALAFVGHSYSWDHMEES